jgi:hypothetical protein
MVRDMSPRQLSQTSPTLVTRVLDRVDRAHAGLAATLHDARNAARTRLELGIDRAEQLTTKLFDGARKTLQRADAAGADSIIRAQGFVGQAIEKARPAQQQLAC